MKFDPCYEYFKQYKSACEEWIQATKALSEFQQGCLTQGKVWQDVRFDDVKKIADRQSAAQKQYLDSLQQWMDCKEGKF